jgi:hypothetical protein
MLFSKARTITPLSEALRNIAEPLEHESLHLHEPNKRKGSL